MGGIYRKVLGTCIGAIRLITLFGIFVTHVLKLKKKKQIRALNDVIIQCNAYIRQVDYILYLLDFHVWRPRSIRLNHHCSKIYITIIYILYSCKKTKQIRIIYSTRENYSILASVNNDENEKFYENKIQIRYIILNIAASRVQ